ncbi:hypothetical protein [Paenibacillus sp.]|uniref:hypothetical protein n=1 Tax=unclassified Paenibacillus TaxID=185978 RepID=UPI0037C78276
MCFYNCARFQAKLNKLSPYKYRTQANKYCSLFSVYLTRVPSNFLVSSFHQAQIR